MLTDTEVSWPYIVNWPTLANFQAEGRKLPILVNFQVLGGHTPGFPEIDQFPLKVQEIGKLTIARSEGGWKHPPLWGVEISTTRGVKNP